jgi:O-antigen/teichoic acid export membrane protein
MPDPRTFVVGLIQRVTSSRLLSAGMWTLGGSFASQVIRFGANLLLTRLLAPEAFGLAAIVTSITVGAELISDLGVGPAVVSSDRVDDPAFLRTAWTLKFVRGAFLGLGLVAVAYPLSLWFSEPALFGMLAVSAGSAALRGGNHICEFTLTRRLDQRTMTLMQLVTNVVGVIATASLALWLQSAWALVFGNAIVEIVQFVVTHYVGRDLKMRFQWEAVSLQSLRRFGRWVFVSSLLTYAVGQGDRIFLGSLMSMADLGCYSLAANLGAMVPNFVGALHDRVLLPLYADEGRATTDAFLNKFARARAGLLWLMLPPLCVLIALGDKVVGLLWDERYQSAGWMLQLFAVGHLFASVGNIGAIHFVRGETWISMVLESVRAVVLLGGVALGYWLGGLTGIIGAIALSTSAGYPLSIWISRRYGVWLPRLDLLAIGGAALAVAVLYGVRLALFG